MVLPVGGSTRRLSDSTGTLPPLTNTTSHSQLRIIKEINGTKDKHRWVDINTETHSHL